MAWQGNGMDAVWERHDMCELALAGPEKPSGFQKVENLRFQDNRHRNVVSTTHRPSLPQEIFLVLISVAGFFAIL
jgi:hypothetical protein